MARFVPRYVPSMLRPFGEVLQCNCRLLQLLPSPLPLVFTAGFPCNVPFRGHRYTSRRLPDTVIVCEDDPKQLMYLVCAVDETSKECKDLQKSNQIGGFSLGTF